MAKFAAAEAAEIAARARAAAAIAAACDVLEGGARGNHAPERSRP
jgi:hypothetical protein